MDVIGVELDDPRHDVGGLPPAPAPAEIVEPGDEQGPILGPHLNDPGEDLVVRGEDLADRGGIGIPPEPLLLRRGHQLHEPGEGRRGLVRLPEASVRQAQELPGQPVGRSTLDGLGSASAGLYPTTPWLAPLGLPSGRCSARPAMVAARSN